MSRFTRLGALPVVLGIALMFVPDAGLYGVLLIALGLGLLTVHLGLLLKWRSGPGRRLTALTACVALAGGATVLLTLSVAAFFERRTDAYLWRNGTDVQLSRPQLGEAADGTGLCRHTGDNWHCALSWDVGGRTVDGQATIDQGEFSGDSPQIPARAMGSLAVSSGAHPRTINNQVLLGDIPFWLALVAIAAEVASWTVALRIFSALTGIGIFRARPPVVKASGTR